MVHLIVGWLLLFESNDKNKARQVQNILRDLSENFHGLGGKLISIEIIIIIEWNWISLINVIYLLTGVNDYILILIHHHIIINCCNYSIIIWQVQNILRDLSENSHGTFPINNDTFTFLYI